MMSPTRLYHARSGIKHMPKYAEIGMKSQVAGRPELDLNDKETIGKIIDRKSARFMGDNAKYAFLSMHDAIEDAKLPKEAYQNNPRAGGILGQGGTSIPDVGETLDAVSGQAQEDRPLPRDADHGVHRVGGAGDGVQIAGFVAPRCRACSTGAHSIGMGMEQIQLGKHDVMFCGSGELENWGSTIMFDGMGPAGGPLLDGGV